MNIDDIIKAINDSNYDHSKVVHDVDAVTPEQKREREKAIRTRCDVSPDVVRQLAEHMNALEPSELMKTIVRLTTEVEKNRLFFVNNELRAHAPFNEAMSRLHAWRQAEGHINEKGEPLKRP